MISCLMLLLFRPDVGTLEARVRRQPNAANYRALADAYVDAGQYQKASGAFEAASVRYARLGDPNAAKVLDDLSHRYATEIRLFAEQPTPPLGGYRPHARFEPRSGCYLGVNIEREDATRDPEEFDRRIGKDHAIFFMYRKYGVSFPSDYARQLHRIDAAIQIAFEPNSLDEVQDDSYLRGFAEDARRSGIPVFLRFASEMNGDWTPYHNDPEAYRAKFRLVAQVMHEAAPNVAMVWCPNEIPQNTIPSYFPGDDAVDWVGVNFYSVIYSDADRARGAEWRRPEDALDFIYRTYSAKHPIMIGEWAATHRSVLDDRDRPDFAIQKIADLYAALPLIYPRVKAVSWLSMNTLKYAMPGRQLNNYSLFDDPSVAEAYTAAISRPYYLSQVGEGEGSPVEYVPLANDAPVRAGDNLYAYARSYDPNPTVELTLGPAHQVGLTPTAYTIQVPADGVPAGGSSENSPPLTHPAPLPPRRLTLNAVVRDRQGRVAGSRSVRVLRT